MVEVDGLGKRREGGEGFGGGTGLEGGADLDFRNADARLPIGPKRGGEIFVLEGDVAGIEAHPKVPAHKDFGV